MDLHMPEQDGLSLTRTLRNSDGANRNAPIVALTADAYQTEAALIAKGMNALLIKPVSFDAFRSTVSRWARRTSEPLSQPASGSVADELRAVLINRLPEDRAALVAASADLKQLLFTLSVCADGAVAVHHKVYAGNRTDDTTPIETWNAVRKITPQADFLYVADSKLCTDEQLSYIVREGGRAITIVPETWAEVAEFKSSVRSTRKAKKEIWRRRKPQHEESSEYFSVFEGQYFTRKRGYRLHWIYSSEKRQRDRLSRESRLAKAERALMELNARLNPRNLKEKEAIEAAATAIVAKFQVAEFLDRRISASQEREQVQIGKGRPGKHTEYKKHTRVLFTLTWTRKTQALKEEAKTDGIFPLLSTDTKLSAKEVLQAYKYQPRLEKRFTQFKRIHHAAPLLFKNITRVEANLFLFFIALVIQSLIEREVRLKMQANGVQSLDVYPEERAARRPTTSKMLYVFETLSTYQILEGTKVVETYKDELTDTQKTILQFLEMTESQYWKPIRKQQ